MLHHRQHDQCLKCFTQLTFCNKDARMQMHVQLLASLPKMQSGMLVMAMTSALASDGGNHLRGRRATFQLSEPSLSVMSNVWSMRCDRLASTNSEGSVSLYVGATLVCGTFCKATRSPQPDQSAAAIALEPLCMV